MLSQLTWRGLLYSAVRPLIAIVSAVFVSAILLAAFQYNPGEAFTSLFEASFKNMRSFGNMLNKACPLLFTGIAVAVGNRGSVFNIGAEGQFLMGATAATWVGITFTDLPGPILMTFMVVAGALGGAAWGFIPGLLKAKYAISEVITTIMFNYIALQLVGLLVRTVLRDRAQSEPQSYVIAQQAFLPYLIPGTKLHPGFLVGCLVALIVFLVLFKSAFGFELRAVGFNAVASKYAGISVNRTTIFTMLLSGGLAGMGGAFELAGNAHYLYDRISSGYGYTAIAVAILAGNNPVGVIFSAMLFGFLNIGSTAMQRNIGLSSYFADIVQSIIIIFVAVAAVNQYKAQGKKEILPSGQKPERKGA